MCFLVHLYKAKGKECKKVDEEESLSKQPEKRSCAVTILLKDSLEMVTVSLLDPVPQLFMQMLAVKAAQMFLTLLVWKF